MGTSVAISRGLMAQFNFASKPRPGIRKAPRIASILLLSFSSLALLTSSTAAADPASDAAFTPNSDASLALRKRFFVGAVGGFALVSASHPELGTRNLMGPVLGLQAGYALSPRWTVSADIMDFETSLKRVSAGEPFTTSTSWLRPLAGCDNCPPPLSGGVLVGTTMHLTTVSPRIEVTPFGLNGLSIGASAGMAIVSGLDARVGASGTARVGFRYRALKVLTVAAEGGAQGQAYSDASAAMYFAAAQARLHF